jgi:hypothetical protein
VAIVDALITRSPNDLDVNRWLPVDEVLRRIADRFPLAVVDRERGDRIVRESVVRLIEVSAHTVVLDDWRAMEGRVAYVTIREAVGGPQFGFFVMSQTTLFEIDYDRPEDRDACRPLLEALATALEYDIVTEDVTDEVLDD